MRDYDDLATRAEILESQAAREIRRARLPRQMAERRLAQARALVLLRLAREDCERAKPGECPAAGVGPLMQELYGIWLLWQRGDEGDVIQVPVEMVVVGPATLPRRERTIWSWAAPHLPDVLPWLDVCPICGEIYVKARRDQQACRHHGQALRNWRKKGVTPAQIEAERVRWAEQLAGPYGPGPAPQAALTDKWTQPPEDPPAPPAWRGDDLDRRFRELLEK